MTLLALLGLLAGLALWVAWLLADGVRALLARRRIEARRKRASTPLRLIVQQRRDHGHGLFGLVLARADRKCLPAFQPGQYLRLACLPGPAASSFAAAIRWPPGKPVPVNINSASAAWRAAGFPPGCMHMPTRAARLRCRRRPASSCCSGAAAMWCW